MVMLLRDLSCVIVVVVAFNSSSLFRRILFMFYMWSMWLMLFEMVNGVLFFEFGGNVIVVIVLIWFLLMVMYFRVAAFYSRIVWFFAFVKMSVVLFVVIVVLIESIMVLWLFKDLIYDIVVGLNICIVGELVITVIFFGGFASVRLFLFSFLLLLLLMFCFFWSVCFFVLGMNVKLIILFVFVIILCLIFNDVVFALVWYVNKRASSFTLIKRFLLCVSVYFVNVFVVVLKFLLLLLFFLVSVFIVMRGVDLIECFVAFSR